MRFTSDTTSQQFIDLSQNGIPSGANNSRNQFFYEEKDN